MAGPGTGKLEELVEAYYSALYRYAFRLSGVGPEAEDLTQETFCQAQVKLAQLRDWTRARNWLFAILRNLYLHRLRAAKKENVVPLDGLAELAERMPEPLPQVDPQHLQEILNALPETFRTPLILFYFEDFSYRDIAEQMDLPIGTVMSRLARAKGFLRNRLSPAAAYATPDEEDA
jgi:RNA polymerase sigma-70 factor (ECF subfamily)